MHLGSLNLVGDSPCHDDIPRFSRIFLSSKFCEIANLQDPRVTFPSHYSCAVFLQSFTKTSPPHMQRRPLKEHPLQPDLAWQRMSISKKVPIHHFVAHWLEVEASVSTDNWHSKGLQRTSTQPNSSIQVKQNVHMRPGKGSCHCWFALLFGQKSHKISGNIRSQIPKVRSNFIMANHVGKGNPVRLFFEYRKYKETLSHP